MDKLLALSLSIGILAGIATYLAVGPATGIFFIWASTIAWAAYFLIGANRAAIINTIANGIFGVFMAWITALLIIEIDPEVSIGVEISTAITVAIAVIVLCLAANLAPFALIPVGVLGYSSTFAYLLQTPEKMNTQVLLAADLNNPLLIISVSFILGTLLGHLSNQIANRLSEFHMSFKCPVKLRTQNKKSSPQR